MRMPYVPDWLRLIDYVKSLHFDYEDIDYLRGLGVFDEDFLDYSGKFSFYRGIFMRFRKVRWSSLANRF